MRVYNLPIFSILTTLLLFGCQRVPGNGDRPDQDQLDRFAETLDVKYTVLNNRVEGRCGDAWRCFSVEIALTSPSESRFAGWELYWSQYFPLHALESDEFDVESINGDLKKIVPNDAYRGFDSGETKVLVLYLSGTHGNYFEAMPNYYVVVPGLEPRVVASTVPVVDAETGLALQPHVQPFTDPDRQFRITDNERIEWATSSVLYSVNQQTPAQPIDVTTSVIPSPASVEHNDTRAVLDLVAGIRVSLQGFARDDVEAALKRLDKLGVTENPAGVVLTITENRNGAEHRDSYSISIGHDAIDISASDAAGAFYALQTLAGLVRLDETTVPQLQIDDQPRYGFRGLHIDLARNFHSLELLTRIVEQMGAYKLNKLHLHLGDDEGWRLEIPGLAELTEVGSRRCHDPSESRCLLPQLGAGPHGDSPVNGYLTTAEYAQLLQYAAARHVQVIPSFDMPGHSRAAVKSMEARYRNLVDRGDETGAGLYLLSDLDDASVYNSIQNYTDNTINVCMESSYRFVTKVIDEVQAIHRDAGVPLTRYHVGADETAGAWRDSPACAGFLAGNEYGVRDVSELGAYFIERVAAILEARGIETAGWGDGLGHTDVENMPAVVQSNAWGRLIDPAHVSAHRHVNHGWEVVLSIPDVAYFDFPYEADPAERGFYWASRQLNTRKVFEFMPDNLPAHAEFWADSEGLDMQLTDNEPMQAGRGFVGIQGQTWSETLRSDEQVEYMLFPRLLALAERAWHRASWEVPYDYEGGRYDRASGRFTEAMRAERDTDWNRFANVVSAKELAKLDAYGIDYRIPTVGAVIRNGRLHCNLIFPGLAIEYRVDGGAWQSCETPVAVNGERVDVRALSADGGRPGRSLRVR